MTLDQLASLVGCTKSYLSGIETGKRDGTPGEALLRRIESTLGFADGELVAIAEWQTTPPSVKRTVSQMQSLASATRRLIHALSNARAHETPAGREASPRSGDSLAVTLDQLYQSGELRRLIDQISPPDDAGSAASAGCSATARPGSGIAGEAGIGVEPLRAMLPVEIPLINSVAAGYPAEFTDLGYPARVADEYVRAPDVHDPDAFAARVVGESMMPDYREGDIVIFSPAKQVKSGMDCFVRLEPDHETTFKRVYIETGSEEGAGAVIRLQPLNPAFAATVLDRERVAGLYAAVGVMRML